MKRVLVIANKVWEVHPLLDALLNPRFQPNPKQPFYPDASYTAWRNTPGAPTRPRAIFSFEHVRVEIWCIADHMDPSKSDSSSQEKNRIMPALFACQSLDPSLVIAFGTGSASPNTAWNGSVFVGSKVFMHDGHPASDPNPKSEWRSDTFNKLLESSVPSALFDKLKDSRADVERKMLAVPINASPLALHCDPNFVAVSTVNITDFREYAVKDPETIQALAQAGVTAPVGSVETTHGLIRVQSNAPFLFVTGIPNRFGRFEEDMGGKPEAQNYVAGFNAGIVTAYLLLAVNSYFAPNCGSPTATAGEPHHGKYAEPFDPTPCANQITVTPRLPSERTNRMSAANDIKPAEPSGDDAEPAPAAKLTRETMIDLYAAQRVLPLSAQREVGLRMPVRVYFKDPAVAKNFPNVGLDNTFTAPWEPGLRDGPTSARFAVVDYDSTTNTLTPPAFWDRSQNCFCTPDDGTPGSRQPITGKPSSLFQFHQVNVWAIVQNTLDFFESGFGLGRRITWAFDGNRLIVLPHAGYGENAFYDRTSKSLQFYYFDGPDGTVFTCLSSDIVNHEFGHAVLDGIRPYYYETITSETAAFHEFLGDLTAILMAFRNSEFRKQVLEESNGDLATGTLLQNLATEFGKAVRDEPYLRSADNKHVMEDFATKQEPHDLSEVLTGAMFDILKKVFEKHREQELERYQADPKRKPSDRRALADSVPRMQVMAIQPLDLLPPCSVTFRDYALALLRAEQVANPLDPDGYRAMMIDVFVTRGILSAADQEELLKPRTVFKRPRLDVFHPIESIAASRGGAYRFLDDNRRRLFIPLTADLVVSEVVRARKLARDGRMLPDQIVVQYVWREEVLLDGPRFGRFAGDRTSMLCGATMVLDENGNQIHWSRKAGSAKLGDSPDQIVEQEAGERRRQEFLDAIAARIAAGTVGETISSELGMVEQASPPFGVRKVDGAIRFELAPHFSIRGDDDAHNSDTGDHKWQISF